MQKNGSVTLIITYYIIRLLLMHNLKKYIFHYISMHIKNNLELLK